jgi:antitoxin component of MazEF toxin-antitoxin module
VQTKILKGGNSLGVRIPRSFAAEAKVDAGSVVDISGLLSREK